MPIWAALWKTSKNVWLYSGKDLPNWLFSLFGKSTRTDTYSYNDLIYSQDSNEVVEGRNLSSILKFEDINTKDVYKIIRISSTQNSKSILSKCSLNVIIEKNGIVIHDGSTREATTYITSLLGTYDDFMTITFMAQNNFHNFLLMSGKNQKEFTSRIFQLDIYDKFHQYCKVSFPEWYSLRLIPEQWDNFYHQ